MFRILLDDAAQTPAVQKFVLIRAQMQDYVRAPAAALSGFNRVTAGTRGFPHYRFSTARPAGDHLNLVGDNKRRVETDAELADQLRIPGLIAGQGIEKL